MCLGVYMLDGSSAAAKRACRKGSGAVTARQEQSGFERCPLITTAQILLYWLTYFRPGFIPALFRAPRLMKFRKLSNRMGIPD